MPGDHDRRGLPAGHGGGRREGSGPARRDPRAASSIAPGRRHIAAIGSECPAGEVVLSPGQPIAPLAVAVLASFGRGTVRVFRRPSMAIVTTGAELALPGRDPQPAQIRNSNGPMLAAMAQRIGIDRPTRLHAQDQVEAIADAIRRAGPREMIVISGGVSAGAYDLVPQAVEAVGAEIVFHKVAQKPGKPFLFARRARQLLFGLPGNPLACHLGFHRYVAAAVRSARASRWFGSRFAGVLSRQPGRSKAGPSFSWPALGRSVPQTRGGRSIRFTA